MLGIAAAHTAQPRLDRIHSIVEQVHGLSPFELAYLHTVLSSSKLCAQPEQAEVAPLNSLRNTLTEMTSNKLEGTWANYLQKAQPKLQARVEEADEVGDADIVEDTKGRRLAESGSGMSDQPTVVVSITSSEDVSAWTPSRLDSIKSIFVNNYNLNDEDVTVSVAPGSSVITIDIVSSSNDEAKSLKDKISSDLDSADKVNSALNITSATGAAETTTENVDDDGLSGGAIAGIVIAVLVGVSLLVLGVVYRKRILGMCNFYAPEGPESTYLQAHGDAESDSASKGTGVMLTGNSKI